MPELSCAWQLADALLELLLVLAPGEDSDSRELEMLCASAALLARPDKDTPQRACAAAVLHKVRRTGAPQEGRAECLTCVHRAGPGPAAGQLPATGSDAGPGCDCNE